MKKTTLITCIISSVLLLSSCQKNALSTHKGNYLKASQIGQNLNTSAGNTMPVQRPYYPLPHHPVDMNHFQAPSMSPPGIGINEHSKKG